MKDSKAPPTAETKKLSRTFLTILFLNNATNWLLVLKKMSLKLSRKVFLKKLYRPNSSCSRWDWLCWVTMPKLFWCWDRESRTMSFHTFYHIHNMYCFNSYPHCLVGPNLAHETLESYSTKMFELNKIKYYIFLQLVLLIVFALRLFLILVCFVCVCEQPCKKCIKSIHTVQYVIAVSMATACGSPVFHKVWME